MKPENSIELYKGISFITPSKPANHLIAGYDLPKKQQKWKRNELLDDWEDWSEEKLYEFAFLEDQRCLNGYWFFVNGVVTYITGHHYFYLNQFQLDNGFADYRDVDRRWFYWWELCDKDEESLGMMYGKKRRDGFSFRSVAIALNKGRKKFNGKYGIISKTGVDAKECFEKLTYGFTNMWSFMKPQAQSAEDGTTKLVLKTPSQRITHKTRIPTKEISLNTKFDWRNTANNSYDSLKMDLLIADESGKWISKLGNFEVWFRKAVTCLTLGSEIVGKMLCGSTVNESDEGGAAFKRLWINSDPTVRETNGRTLTGLLRYFVPCYDGLEGFIDEYGNSIIDTPEKPVMGINGKLIKIGSKQYKQNLRKSLRDNNDLVGYYEECRQYPFTEDDMFLDPSNEKPCFNLDRIHEQIEHNEIHVVDHGLVLGNFEWENGVRDSVVVFSPCSNGRFLVAWMPPLEQRNKSTLHLGLRAPGNTHIGLISLDPFVARQTVSKKQSKAASHGFRKFDVMSKEPTNCYIFEYWCRPPDPLIVYNDMLLASVFYGWKTLPERNIRNCNDFFYLKGYQNYLMQKPNITQEDFKEQNKKRISGVMEDAGIANSGEHVRQQLIEYQMNYIVNNIGVNPLTGNMGYMPFTNTLKDWLVFDPDKWTDYDLTVSSMVAVVGSKDYVIPKKDKKISFDFFPKYNNNGMISQIIK